MHFFASLSRNFSKKLTTHENGIRFSKKDTLRSYQAVIEPFCREFGERTISQVVPDEILSFLNRLTDGNNPCIKRVRYSQLSCIFNFVRNNIEPESANPCDTPMIRKQYLSKVITRWEIIEKETVDKIIGNA